MILSDDVIAKFKDELAQVSEWASLGDSQFVEHLAIFAGWLVEQADFAFERAYQESFYDSALNRSSLLAHAEGLSYVPAKPEPPSGVATITNNGEATVALVRDWEFLSDAQESYMTDEAVVIPAGESAEVSISQRSIETYEEEVESTTSFYEFLFDRDVSPQVVSYDVFVDEQDGEGFRKYEYDYLLTNCYEDTRAYSEFYHFTDQLGIRFGNGTFGVQMRQGWTIRVVATLTNGDTMLLAKASLWSVNEPTDYNGQTGNIDAVISTTVQGGQDQESTEILRRNLHYAAVYNERLVWANDYKYFLKRRYRDIVFAVAWGEDTAEEMWGTHVEFINHVWICAYSPDRDMQELCMAAVEEIPSMNRHYVWHDPEHVQFWVKIEGQVLQNQPMSEVREAIIDKLEEYYGRDSDKRRDNVYLHDIYALVQDTGYFEKDTEAYFRVEVYGQLEAEYIYQMVSIDMEQTEIAIEFVK